MAKRKQKPSPEKTAASNWDRWADVRSDLEEALRDPGHILGPDEWSALLEVLAFSLHAQAELHLLRPGFDPRKAGLIPKTQGKVKWAEAGLRYASLVSEEHKRIDNLIGERARTPRAGAPRGAISPEAAVRVIMKETGDAETTVCKQLESQRAKWRRTLRNLEEAGEGVPPDFLRKVRWIANALGPIPEPAPR